MKSQSKEKIFHKTAIFERLKRTILCRQPQNNNYIDQEQQ